MATLTITDRWLKSRECRPLEGESRSDFWDDSHPGLVVRVHESGRKVFQFRYRTITGVKRRMPLGNYPATSLATARKKARRVRKKLDDGDDPAAEKAARKAAPAFAELAVSYIEHHAKRHKRSWREDQRQLDRDLLPAWKQRKAGEIKRADVLDLLDEIVDRGSPVQANRTRALVSKIYEFGIERGVVESNPARGVKRPAPERSRDRVLTEDEIRRLWLALEPQKGRMGLSPLMAAAFRLLLLTAQREVEVVSMAWADLDGDWWTIPAGVAKNKQAHRVPLSPQARGALDAIFPLSEGSPWAFPSPIKKDDHMKPQSLQNPVQELRARMKVLDWRPHDLRRTASTLMEEYGIADHHLVSKILNHADRGVTAVYARAERADDKRRALSAWGAEVERIVSGKPRDAKIAGRIG
jgi:integrase